MSEPSTARFHRETMGNWIAMIWSATRPAFLSASVLSVLCACAMSWALAGGAIPIGLAFGALIVAVLVHAGANVINDYFDDRIGTDRINEKRVFPFSGGSRFIQNGVLSRRETLWFAIMLLTSGALAGLALALEYQPALLWVGAAGGVGAIVYSMPGGLASRGLGEITIAVCFGVLPVVGTSLLLLGSVPPAAWWVGAAIGIYTTAILWVNSIPDIEADRASGKHTLPSRLGAKRAAMGLPLLFILGGGVLAVAPIPLLAKAGLLALFPGYMASRALLADKLMPAIPLTLIAHAVLCLATVSGFVASMWHH